MELLLIIIYRTDNIIITCTKFAASRRLPIRIGERRKTRAFAMFAWLYGNVVYKTVK